MTTYLNNLITEKNLNVDFMFEVEGAEWGVNFIPLEVVVEHMILAPKDQQKQMLNTLTKIDFQNGDVMHYFKYLAGALAR